MNACGKARYPTRLDAMVILARLQMKASRNKARHESRVYECPRCKGWHLTSQPQRKAAS